MNAIIRHAESLKIEVNGEMLKPLTPRGVLAAIDYAKFVYEEHELFWKKETDVYTFDRSPQVRAIETSEAIVYGLRQIDVCATHLDGIDTADVDLESRITLRTPDNRLDVANFLPGHAPHEVGAAQSYIDCIELDSDEVYKVTARVADYVLSNLDNNHVIGVSHHVPMMLLLYAMGFLEKDAGVIPNLGGFQYGRRDYEGERFIQFWDCNGLGSTDLVRYDELKELSEGKIKARLKSKCQGRNLFSEVETRKYKK